MRSRIAIMRTTRAASRSMCILPEWRSGTAARSQRGLPRIISQNAWNTLCTRSLCGKLLEFRRNEKTRDAAISIIKKRE